MKDKKDGCCWLSGESNGWLAVVLFVSLYCGAFFGFNAVRSLMDGHVGIVCVLLSGAVVSVWAFCSACVEVARRWRERSETNR